VYNILTEFVVPMKLIRLIKMCLNGKVCIGKHLSHDFPVQNGLKQGDTLLPMLSNFALVMPLGRPNKTRWNWN
jgi:hypothetical protein